MAERLGEVGAATGILTGPPRGWTAWEEAVPETQGQAQGLVWS